MKRGKIKPMVAVIEKRGPGRPRKYEGASRQVRVTLPMDLHDAAEKFCVERKLAEYTDALRELIREAAEARGLVEPRK